MERCVSYGDYTINFSYPWNPGDSPTPGMGRLALAGFEYGAICSQYPELLKGLGNDLKRLPTGELSCRDVVDKTYESELFQVFARTSKYRDELWNEGFAREMAHDASKLMDMQQIRCNPELFCWLSCISFADLNAKITDIDMAKLPSEIIKFIYIDSPRYREVTVTNLANPENRKVTSKFVKSPTFAENNPVVHGIVC